MENDHTQFYSRKWKVGKGTELPAEEVAMATSTP